MSEHGDDLSSVHTVPIDDLVEHGTSEDCVCGPTPTLVPRADGGDAWAYLHHSLDGRELSEADHGWTNRLGPRGADR